jgi:hypothetical protein
MTHILDISMFIVYVFLFFGIMNKLIYYIIRPLDMRMNEIRKKKIQKIFNRELIKSI